MASTQGWVGDDKPGETVYAEKVGKPENIETYSRVVVHSNRLESSDWKTASQQVYQVPEKRAGDLRTYVDTSKVGPRTAAMLQQLAAEAAVAPPPNTIPRTMETTAMATYKAHDLTGVKVGARVMQSQDGVPIPPEQCDFTFRAESGMCKKANIDAIRAAPVDGVARLNETAGGSVYEDVPYTLYQQKVAAGAYPSNDIFGTTSKGPNAFTKNSDYSKPITDHTKDPVYVE